MRSAGRDYWAAMLPLSIAAYWMLRTLPSPPDLAGSLLSQLSLLIFILIIFSVIIYKFIKINRREINKIHGYEFAGFRLSPVNRKGEIDVKLSELMDLLSALGVSSMFVFYGPQTSNHGPSVGAYGAIWSKKDRGELLTAAMKLMRSTLEGVFIEEVDGTKVRSLVELGLTLPTPTDTLLTDVKVSGLGGEEFKTEGQVLVSLGSLPSGRDFAWDLKGITRHVAILGRSGSGKTTTAMTMARALWDAGIPFLVLDYHGEYGAMVLELGGRVIPADDLSVNLLYGLTGSDPKMIGAVIDVLDILLDLTPTQLYIVEKCLGRLQAATLPGDQPTLADLHEEISEFRERTGPEFESKLSLLRKLEPLVSGEGEIHLMKNSIPDFDVFREAPVSIEVGGISTDLIRDAVTHSILGEVYNRARERGITNYPLMAVILEEADHVLPRLEDRRGMTISDRMFSELRKFGVGMVVISQTPAGLSRHVLRNSATKVFHALGEPEDIRVAISLIGRDIPLSRGGGERAADILPILRPGEAVFVHEGSVNLVRIRRPDYPQISVGSAIEILKRAAPEFYGLDHRPSI